LTLALALPLGLWGQEKMPMLKSLDKTEALRGDVVTVTGTNLGKPVVADLFLTLGSDDVKLKILEQTDTTIRFQVGATTKFGRWGLMVLTGGATPTYMEQPVKLNVVEKLAPKEDAPAPAEAPPAPAEPPTPPNL
jgi:hypothetical protein